jgi:subtilisin family serine protease
MNNNLPHLPPVKITMVVSTLSQTQDWGIKQLRIPDTWSVTKGAGEMVLVIDTGMPLHTDLLGAITVSQCKTFIPEEDTIDYQGHSTHCCGIIGARNNDFGCVGVAPECQIVTYKALNKDGIGGSNSIVDALNAAILLKPSVISMSLGCALPDEEQERLIKKLYDMNIPIIAAAGNEGSQGTGYPASYKEPISIGAYDKNKSIAYFSSIGKVDFCMPGVDIYSTFINNKYCQMSGTSMATPYMAGVVALLLAKHRKQEKETGKNDCKTVEQIIEHLKKYSIDVGPTGKDEWFGYGIIDVNKMITTVESVDKPIVVDPYLGFGTPTKWQKVKDWFWKTFVRPL